MVIISQSIVNAFAREYPLAAYPLNRWYREASKADWRDFTEMKRSFNTVDSIGNDRYVFDIGGNNYRLVAMVHFNKRTLYVRFIGTHKQYDQVIKSGLLKNI
jgi:mRNA interferase HigB